MGKFTYAIDPKTHNTNITYAPDTTPASGSVFIGLNDPGKNGTFNKVYPATNDSNGWTAAVPRTDVKEWLAVIVRAFDSSPTLTNQVWSPACMGTDGNHPDGDSDALIFLAGWAKTPVVIARGTTSTNGVGVFGSSYMKADGTLATIAGTAMTYSGYLAGLKALQLTSASNVGTQMTRPITSDDLVAIYPLMQSDLNAYKAGTAPANSVDVGAAIQQIADRLNDAWRIFLIDTVEGRSGLLGNATIESGQCRFLTETTGANTSNRAYEPDPTALVLNDAYFNTCRDTGKDTNGNPVVGYNAGGEVNPLNNGWGNAFIGRGAIQVTNRSNYLETLAVMDHRIIELKDPNRANPQSTDDADVTLLTDAITAIKNAPAQAGSPSFGYLFSCAMMKQPKVNGDVKSSQGNIFDWMGQGQPQVPAKNAGFAAAKAQLAKS